MSLELSKKTQFNYQCYHFDRILALFHKISCFMVNSWISGDLIRHLIVEMLLASSYLHLVTEESYSQYKIQLLKEKKKVSAYYLPPPSKEGGEGGFQSNPKLLEHFLCTNNCGILCIKEGKVDHIQNIQGTSSQLFGLGHKNISLSEKCPKSSKIPWG